MESSLRKSYKIKFICKKCERKLYRRDFYRNELHSNGIDSVCKECRKRDKREAYDKTKKVPEGIRLNAKGQTVIYTAGRVKLYWSETKKRDFAREFPYNTNDELAIMFGCSPRTIVRRARQMGLEKNPVWLMGVWDKNREQAHFINKIRGPQNLPQFIEGGKKTRFGSSMKEETPEQARERLNKSWTTRRRKYGQNGIKRTSESSVTLQPL